MTVNERNGVIVERVALAIATGCGSGLAPKAPGTVGSVAALFFLVALSQLGIPLVLTAGLLIPLGWWATTVVLRVDRERGHASEDPQRVVIDEWAGLAVALVPVGFSAPLAIALAFILFRAFDATKWGLVGRAEELPGALGIMADDLVAGFYAGGLTALVVLFLT